MKNRILLELILLCMKSPSNTLLNVMAVVILKQVSSVELVKGDVIVMGSDGLFDNVFDSEIVSTIAANSDATDTGKLLRGKNLKIGIAHVVLLPAF